MMLSEGKSKFQEYENHYFINVNFKNIQNDNIHHC